VAAPVDPNWLLSTTAQSAAALVGIVGGFLVSRVIAIASERQSLQRRSRELGDMIELQMQRESEIRQRRLDAAVHKFLTVQARDIVGGRPVPGIEDLLEDYTPPGGELADLRRRAPEAIEAIKRAEGRLSALFGSGYVPTSRRELAEAGVDMQDTDPWIYEIVAEELNRRRPRDIATAIAASVGPHIGRSFADVQDDLQREEQRLAGETSALIGQQALLDLDATRMKGLPRGVLPGVVVLAFFGVVGIVLPLYDMSQRPVPAGVSTRQWVFTGFAAGFAALMIYLFWVAFVLPRDQRETPSEWAHRQRLRVRQWRRGRQRTTAAEGS